MDNNEITSNSVERTKTEQNKALRFVEFLKKLTDLRSTVERDIQGYERVFWLDDVPNETGCFTQAWGSNQDFDEDLWIQIRSSDEPATPSVPDQCREWVDSSTLHVKTASPKLRDAIDRLIPNPGWEQPEQDEISDIPEFLRDTHQLADNPQIQQTWETYVRTEWADWVSLHDRWDRIHQSYTKLFTIRQDMIRLGEDYELVIGVGVLSWHPANKQLVRRHLVVANAELNFEAEHKEFIVRPATDGADLRPELDMLDPDQLKGLSESNVKSDLEPAADNPWDKGSIQSVLTALTNTFSADSQYSDALERPASPASEPRCTFSPALILRKRSVRSLTAVLQQIDESIRLGLSIPAGFIDLIEGRNPTPLEADDSSSTTERMEDPEIYFPKPANDEQQNIVEQARRGSGVLVQGPPGTGKSHTIANLISHFLATGKRVLITAKTPRALQVLQNQLPAELRPLCINLLGQGQDERQAMESSVTSILQQHQSWDQSSTDKDIASLRSQLKELREEKSAKIRQLRALRESELHDQSVAGGAYKGTAAAIAKSMNAHRAQFDWFNDTVPLDGDCPLESSSLHSILNGLRWATPEKREKLGQIFPDLLPDADKLAGLFEHESHTKTLVSGLNTVRGHDKAGLFRAMPVEELTQYAERVQELEGIHKRLNMEPLKWAPTMLLDLDRGQSSRWQQLHAQCAQILEIVEPLVVSADNAGLNTGNRPTRRTPTEALNSIRHIQTHLRNGGKLGWTLFPDKRIKEHLWVLKELRIRREKIQTSTQIQIAADALTVITESKRMRDLWRMHEPNFPKGYVNIVRMTREWNDIIVDALNSVSHRRELGEIATRFPGVEVPDLSNIDSLIQWRSAAKIAITLQSHEKCNAIIEELAAQLQHQSMLPNAHNVTRDLANAVAARDHFAYVSQLEKVEALRKDRDALKQVDELVNRSQEIFPNLTTALASDPDNPNWLSHIAGLNEAWAWAQARLWVESYIGQGDERALTVRVKRIENDINQTIGELAAKKAWTFCMARLEDEPRRHMVLWQQSMKRLGKGTGKYAVKHRKDAQESLSKCRDAIPAWVMPIHRVWDTIKPVPGMFDAVIVDEASQCGHESFPLMFLAKKILIVGDDKQISPEAIGIDQSTVNELQNELLSDFKYKSAFDLQSSLFAQGQLRYGDRRVVLREHFRCMPEIIEFSNRLCYADTPLIPLRQYGTERLRPLRRVFVEGGFTKGKDSRIINEPEADMIVEEIVSLCEDERYECKSMGVVTLQGNAQAELIESMLMTRLGVKEMDARQLICGSAYSFQGDERDVIFLSMVAAPNRRIGTMSKDADVRRFNVAASRARDQMYLFHSAKDSDLGSGCLRRKLLQFFEEDSKPPEHTDYMDWEIAAKNGNRSINKAPKPFDSWFELDVAVDIVRREYDVQPQYPVAGRFIDLVVEGGQARLAVECDGDHWHGAENYDADIARQIMLERCGWEFFRVRESAYYADPINALSGLWDKLNERAILSRSQQKLEAVEDPESENVENEELELTFSAEDDHEVFFAVQSTTPTVAIEPSDSGGSANFNLESANESKRPSDISAAEIKETLVTVLVKRPNNSCKSNDASTLVLRELGIRTRGAPKRVFDSRIKRAITDLEKSGKVERYKAKNDRIRLTS